MSSDCSGILYYGWAISEEDMEVLYEKHGGYHEINDAWQKRTRPEQPEDKTSYRTPEWDAWRQELQKWKKGPQNVEIEWSGGESCEQYYVHCGGLKKKVCWAEQMLIAPEGLVVPEEYTNVLFVFAGMFSIPFGDPHWHLATRWF